MVFGRTKEVVFQMHQCMQIVVFHGRVLSKRDYCGLTYILTVIPLVLHIITEVS